MGERFGSHRGNPSRETYSLETEDLAPDDACFVPERVVAAADVAERARKWLDTHPESSFTSPPADGDKPKVPPTEDEINALIEEVTVLARPSAETVVAAP